MTALKMNILINAYSCSPNMGSEPGMAWNWCVNLAKYCELYIITEEEFRYNIEAVVPTLPQGKNMHFYFNPLPEKVRVMCRNQGDWRFYYYYRQWQKKTLEIAKQICKEHDIDILHQLNMIGYREPGLLWKIKGPKFVWGPIGGLGQMPVSYLKGAGIKTNAFNRLKNMINALQYRYQYNVRQAVFHANALIAATSGSQKKLQDFYHKPVYLINETGCNVMEHVDKQFSSSETMNLLWVGKMDFRKQLHLAVAVLGKLKDLDVILHVCGSGMSEQISNMEMLAHKLGVSDKLNYHGVVTHDEVLRMMKLYDLLLFTSISEGTPHVVQEAIAYHLPVVCHDTCGQGDCVDESIGYKVPISCPKQSVEEFATFIRKLYYKRDKLKELSENCFAASQKMSWDKKVHDMLDIYQKCLKS